MKHCCCDVFDTEEGAHPRKEFFKKLSIIVSVDVRWNPVVSEPIRKENIFDVSVCCLGHRNSFSQLGVSLGSDRYVLLA